MILPRLLLQVSASSYVLQQQTQLTLMLNTTRTKPSAAYARGGTKNEFWMVLRVSFVFCHVRLFLAVTLSMNTLLPTAVAATRL